MNSSKNLFELIRSATPAEKRHFRLFSGIQGGEKQYMELFDQLEIVVSSAVSPENYPVFESQVKQSLSEKEKIKPSHFPVIKSYLYNQLLQSLRVSKEDRPGPESRICLWTREAELLEEKGLYGQAYTRLEKARRLAEKYEKHYLLVEILDRLIKLNNDHPADKRWYDKYEFYENEKARTIENLQVESGYKRIYYESLALFKAKADVENSMEKLTQKLAHPWLETPEKAQTFNAQIYLYSTLSFRFLQESNQERMIYFQKKVIQTWEQYEHMIEDNLTRYKIAIYNYLIYSHSIMPWQEFHAYIENYKNPLKKSPANLSQGSPDDQIADFQRLTQLEFIYLLNTGQIEKSMVLTYEVEARLSDPVFEAKLRPGSLAWIRFSCFLSFFFTEQYRESLDRLEKIRSMASGQRNDVKLVANLLGLIALFELNLDDRIQDHNAAAALYQLKKSATYRHFEKLVFNHLKKLRQAQYNPALLRKQLEKFDQAFDEFETANAGLKIDGKDEVKIWLKAKVADKPMKMTAMELATPPSAG